ncbi:MAG: DUF1538 domain-containing protein, partial [Desulfovibrionaceae bacterium]|nr:DUF1538 domain-containing protein [Desulfovibrionaceae bacterium]
MLPTLTHKLRESAVSVIPIMALVAILHFTVAPLGAGQLPQFILGGLLLILGLAVFLIGAELGMVAFGQKTGAALTRRRNLPLILGAVLAIGFAVTIAEPDIQVLGKQVHAVRHSIDRQTLILMIALGVGGFLMLGVAKTVFQLPLRWLLVGFYLPVFGACAFVDAVFVGVAFDAGGATTGPITVPFIIAMGVGVASAAKREKEDDDSSFGWVGLASIGPIAAVAFMGMISPATASPEDAVAGEMAAGGLVERFLLHALPEAAKDISMAILPIFLIFLLFQATLLRLPPGQMRRMTLGFLYASIGLVIFMTGVSGGFIPVGYSLGVALGTMGGAALVPVGFLLGAVVVCAEPAVWVLNEQVEELSGGHIRRSLMLAAL